MAFVSTNLTKVCNLLSLATSNETTPGLFFYNAGADTFATVATAGYFTGVTWASASSIIDVLCADGRHSFKVTSALGASPLTVLSTGLSDKMASGQATTVTAVDTIVTGLGTGLKSVVACFADDVGLTWDMVTCNLGDQNVAPAPGSFYLKSWEPTSNANPTPIAATTFGKKVNWIAIAS